MFYKCKIFNVVVKVVLIMKNIFLMKSILMFVDKNIKYRMILMRFYVMYIFGNVVFVWWLLFGVIFCKLWCRMMFCVFRLLYNYIFIVLDLDVIYGWVCYLFFFVFVFLFFIEVEGVEEWWSVLFEVRKICGFISIV